MKILAVAATILFLCRAANPSASLTNEAETLSLDVIVYDSFIAEDGEAMAILKKALFQKGIVGIKGIPGYVKVLREFIQTAREFSALPEEIKTKYSPNRNNKETLGYERGAEQFKRPDGRWVTDNLKVSYYALLPNHPSNKWPAEIDLRGPYERLGQLMAMMGEEVMIKIGLIQPSVLEKSDKFGRMLHYDKGTAEEDENPFWCGAHFDHGMFTSLVPSFYFLDGQEISEPADAGLFVRNNNDGAFKKILCNDPDIMLFQVGEYGQIMSNDSIRATEHRVHKAKGGVERYTMAAFFSGPPETIYSTSVLTYDSRYKGGGPGTPCNFEDWHQASLARYHVPKND